MNRTTYYATKSHMTQTWTTDGKRLAVTVAKLLPATVSQVKSDDTDGYAAVQVSFGQGKKANNKPMQGHLANAKIQNKPAYIRELTVTTDTVPAVGDTLNFTDFFNVGSVVNVTGTSKGKGFAGGMKRWNFKGGPKTHGQSDRSRAPGSIGQGTTPGRVFKGKKMAGHMGVETKTVKNLKIVDIDVENGIVLISGPVPGHNNSVIKLTKVNEGNAVELFYKREEPKAEEAKNEEAKDNGGNE